MPKRKTPEDTGIRALTPVLRHVNEQTFGADASVVIAEAIETPGYAGDFGIVKDERPAMLLTGAEIYLDPQNDNTTLHAEVSYRAQIMQGDQTALTDLARYTDEDLIADIRMEVGLVTTGANGPAYWPIPMKVLKPMPLIVTREFTVLHQADNIAEYNSQRIYCILEYQVVAVETKVYTQILLDAQRIS